jgi:predicted transcriptional regulator
VRKSILGPQSGAVPELPMSDKRRSHLDTIYAVLKACERGSKPTRVMQRANLNHAQLKRYVALLIGYSLLEEVDNQFHTTAKGRLFMTSFERLVKVMNE